MNRIDQLFKNKQEKVLSIYFTAGFPKLEDTRTIMKALEEAGADIIEIGVPYSDPVADGPTIQESNKVALDNGMSLKKLFSQLEGMRSEIKVPVILMGYLNPIMQYGIEAFCKKCDEVGVDGIIVPDLPMQQYLDEYKLIFNEYNLRNTFLISPQTSEKRIREIDEYSDGFIYMVSSHSITGAKEGITDAQVNYFQAVQAMELKSPRLIGFGISDHNTFIKASTYSNGAIIGSAFIKVLQQATDLENEIKVFIKSIKEA
ncbi:MAG TPA: tryptophan synthase subunit alpha [Cyclobacteriaceae bacterium]|nr:tryptophan synthase subunit alpha [Cyclobacteriaceae bacterium]